MLIQIGGIPVEISGKICGIFSGISMVYQFYASGIPMETRGKIWWYYHCYQLI